MQIFLEFRVHLGDALTWCAWGTTLSVLAPSSPGTYSAALRSLPRTERISLSVAHEAFMLTPGNEIRHQPTETRKGDVFTKRMEPTKFETALETESATQVSPPVRRLAGQPWTSLTTYDLNIYSYLLDLIFNMFVLIFDMFVVSFDMFLLIPCQSDLNFGLIIYSYSGQFASTATRASSSTSRNFLCRLQLRGESWGDAIHLVDCIFIPAGLNDLGFCLP